MLDLKKTSVLITVSILGLSFCACSSSAKEFTNAVNAQNSDEMLSLYYQAISDDNKVSSYDEIILSYIDSVEKDINEHEFTDEELSGADDIITTYMNQNWDMFDELKEILDQTTADRWEYTSSIIESKKAYEKGLIQEDYQDKINYFNEVLVDDSFYSRAVENLNSAALSYTDNELEEAKEMMTDVEWYSEGVDMVRELEDFLSEYNLLSGDIEQMIQDCEKQCAEQQAANAESYFKDRNIELAVSSISAACEILPEESSYREKKTITSNSIHINFMKGII